VLRTFLRRLFASGKPALLAVGSPAPDFEERDHRGDVVRLADFAGKRVVVYFYPKADTPGCTKQACGFRDQDLGFGKIGVEVLGVSFDPPAENAAFAEKYGLGFRLLCDVDRSMGLAYKACENKDDAYPRRITYVIGPDARIEQAIDTKDAGGQAAELLGHLRPD
jgi:peroxiredoxin Q/BCP